MDQAQEIIQSMSLEEKAGQLFMVAFPTKDFTKIIPLIQKYQIAGCYISDDNATNFQEAKNLTENLQREALKRNKNLPLFFGVDQEGAWSVLSEESISGPGNLALGSADNLELTQKMYSVFSDEMSQAGYQVILSPCCDVNLNSKNPIINTRSFGEISTSVAKHVKAAVKGIQQNGCFATAKHFSGHGDTQIDTHRQIPTVGKSKQEVFENELLPFQAAIDAGVDFIMTSHILYTNFDDQYPATLSHKILTNLLRKNMGFKGLIITDSMNMGAIRKCYSIEESTLLALKSGADFIMLAEEHYDHNDNYLKNQIRSINAVINGVKNKEIDLALIEEKLTRIIHWKLKSLLHFDGSKKNLTTEEKKNIEYQVSFEAIKVLKNESNLLPVDKNQTIALVNASPIEAYNNVMNIRGIGPNQKISGFNTLVEKIRTKSKSIEIYHYEDIESHIKQIEQKDIILLVTEDYPLPGEDFDKTKQTEMVKKFVSKFNQKLILVGLRSPYELEDFPDVKNYICSYSSRNCSAEAIVDKIFTFYPYHNYNELL